MFFLQNCRAFSNPNSLCVQDNRAMKACLFLEKGTVSVSATPYLFLFMNPSASPASQLHYESVFIGVQVPASEYIVDVESMDIFPVGWCEANAYKLSAPPKAVCKYSTWINSSILLTFTIMLQQLDWNQWKANGNSMKLCKATPVVEGFRTRFLLGKYEHLSVHACWIADP